MHDPIIVGAGPCGLSVAIETKKRGMNPLVIEKGCLVNSIYHFPTHMQFFSTPELLEIGGIPFVTAGEKPVRAEALKYYRAVTKKYELKVHTYEKVIRAEKGEGGFAVFTEGRDGRENRYETPHLVIATGYYDNPNRMNIPGEDLPKVHHYFREAHPYADLDVLVVGGKNSAVEAALELHRAGARVTMAYRREAFTGSVKAWVKPVIESAINKGWIRMFWNTEVKEIRPDHVVLEQEGREFTLPNDAVFAMTGYRPDFSMLRRLGVSIDPETGAPVHDPETMETGVPGLYIAGVIAAGNDANSIFIENGRFHGERIARHLEAIRAEVPGKG
jgi:thioredoxin reductase (NADPH)